MAGNEPAPASQDGREVPADPAVFRELAPTGVLRVAINLGNIAVAQRGIVDGKLVGIGVELANCLAAQCRLPLKWVEYRSAGEVMRELEQQSWDVAFLAIDSTRQAQLAFTPPYMKLEGRYAVRADSMIESPAQLDSTAVQIAVTAGSAYELHLDRQLKLASLVRFATSAESFAALAQERVDAAAGVGSVIRKYVSDNPSLRILDPAFMSIEHGMAIPLARAACAQYLVDFVKRQISSGRVAAWLRGAAVASTDAEAPTGASLEQ